jgi:two-component system, OmpR family, sensor histidine kinase CiaH
VNCDRGTLRRLLVILLDNAVKYTPAAGKIDVHIEEHREKVIVAIEDNGFGISGDDLAHIFYRSEKLRSRDSGGSGLWLSLAKWIVDVHGGAIDVASQPDRGGTFTVSQPKVKR